MTAAPRPYVWLSPIRSGAYKPYEVNCFDHGPVYDPDGGWSLMPLRRARQVRRQHLSDFHGHRWLWSAEDRWDWEER